MRTLHIRILGDFALAYGDTPITNINTPRLQSLLAYLMLHQGAPQSRHYVAFLFWPDSTEAQARNNLRQILYLLRRTLPAADEFLQIETNTVQWRSSAAYTLDVTDFEYALAQAATTAEEGRATMERTALESAVNQYHGDLLPGCYDDWILSIRERLSQAYFGALERLVLLTEAQGDYRSGINYAERLLRHDPLHETTYRHLMRLHALNGDRASALRAYHNCVSLLERELGVEPNAEIQEAYQRLLNMAASSLARVRPPAVSAARLALVGRQDEWYSLQIAWQHAAAGQAALVLISGEAGIGKTRLAEEFLAWAAQQGATTARTRAYAAEGQLAFAPVTELLRTDALRPRLDDIWLTELARLLPELLAERPDLPKPEPINESWPRQHLFEALTRAVLSDKAPLLLLDDLQWCDQDTLEWLHYLLHFASKAGLLIVGTVRPEEIGQSHPLTPLLLDLRLREQLTEINLGPLDADETATLAAQMAGRELDAGQLSRLYQYTEGNPLFVVETIRAEMSRGETDRSFALPSPATPQGPPISTQLPAKVRAVIQARLGQLSSFARELAALAATIGRAFTFDVLAQASESDEETLVRALDELWWRRIVREQGNNAYDFSHDRICEVAYAEVSAARRQMLHRRVATALEQLYATNLDAVSGQIAAHYEQAGRAALAIAYYQRAAAVAQQTFSNSDVINLLTRSLALLPLLPDTPQLSQTELAILVARGTALMLSRGYGHPEVEQTLLRAWALCQTLGRPAQTIPVLAGLWVCYQLKGKLAQATMWAEHLEHEVRTTSNAEFQVMAYFALSGSALFRGDLLAVQQYAQQGLAAFEPGRSGPQSLLIAHEPRAGIIPYQALGLWLLGYPDQARTQMQMAIKRASISSQPAALGFVLSMVGVLHQFGGEVQLVIDQASATMDYSTEKEMPQWIVHNQILQGWALIHRRQVDQGQVDRGLQQVRQGLAVWQAMGSGLALTYYLLLLAEVCTIGARPEEGLDAVAQALSITHEHGETWMEAELYRRQGELLFMQGADEQEVEACFRRALEIARHQQARSFELRAVISLSRLWQRQGKHAEAHQILAEIYGWFSEGLDSADLLQAKTLLDSLTQTTVY